MPPRPPETAFAALRGELAAWWLDLRRVLAVYTQLPLPAPPDEAGALARALRAGPLAGLVVGALGAGAFAAADGLGLPPLVAGTAAVAATLLLTGAMHEDGLADVADAFGGGVGRPRKLAILRDSRLGAYGGAALVLSIMLRAGALASLTPAAAAVALAAAHAASRATLPAVMQALRPAREEGLGAGAGRPPKHAVLAAAGLGLGLALVLLGWTAGLLAAAAAAAAAVAVARLARAQIGGYTGDVLGAVQQAAESAVLLAAAALLA